MLFSLKSTVHVPTYLFASVLVAFAASAWYFRRTVYFIILTAVGRNRYATVGQVLRVPFHLPNYMRPQQVAKQISALRTDTDGYTLWSTPLGELWAPKGAGSIAEMISEQMRSEYGVGKQGVQVGDTVIDGGANIGAFSKQALRAGAGKVIALEPSPENLECLRRNFVDEILEKKLVIVPKGLWCTAGLLSFGINPAHQEAGKIISGPRELPAGHMLVEISVTTIDSLKQIVEFDKIDFIKLDIEGAERQALAGAVRTLRTDKPKMAICMYHLDDDIDVLPAQIRKTNPAYTIECGKCLSDGSLWRLRPNILFFR